MVGLSGFEPETRGPEPRSLTKLAHRPIGRDGLNKYQYKKTVERGQSFQSRPRLPFSIDQRLIASRYAATASLSVCALFVL